MTIRKNYTNTIAMAKRLIEKFGREIVFTLPAGKRGVYNPLTSSPVGIADIRVEGNGVMLDFTEYEKRDTNIIQGDKKIIFFSDSALKIGMIATIDNVEWEVVQPNPLKPANDLICYFAQVRS